MNYAIDQAQVTTDAADNKLLAQLRERLHQAGFFLPPDGFLLIKAVVLTLIFSLAYAALLTLRHGGLLALTVGLLGLSMVQFSLLAHECGHFAASRKRWVNDLWGYFGMSLICGVSFSRWRPAHNSHHRSCQEELEDPDMQFDVLLSVHERSAARKTGFGKWIRPYQAYYFWPLTLLYWLSMRYDGLVHLFQQPKKASWDWLALPAHYVLWLVIPGLVIGPRLALVAYAIASCLLALLSAAIFAVNHIGMPIIRTDESKSFLRQQIECSRNIDNHPIWDHFFSGLNFQIEHHLFPYVAHHRLRLGQPITQQFCTEHGIPYQQASFSAALIAVTAHLRAISQSAEEKNGQENPVSPQSSSRMPRSRS